MKNLLLIISLLAVSATNSKAQDSATMRKNLLAIIADAKNEFPLTKGEMKKDTSTKYTYYISKQTLGSGFAEIIVTNKDDSKRLYADYVQSNVIEYANGENAVKAAKSIMTEWRKTGKYTSGTYFDYDDLGDDIEITYLRDLEGNYIMETEEGYDFKAVYVYSKKWGKK